jgi:hypothetical protein
MYRGTMYCDGLYCGTKIDGTKHYAMAVCTVLQSVILQPTMADCSELELNGLAKT